MGRRTFLFTDIEGSTRLWERHPEAMGSAVAAHDEVVRSFVEAHGGEVFKTLGDAFCVAFPDAAAACRAALEAQLGLHARTWGETGPLKVRMCLHAGVAETRDGDFFGQTVNRTARIMALGHGGQILVSAAAERELDGALPERARLLDLGTHKLRDLSEPEQVFQVLHPALASEFAPLRSLDTLPNNLPLQLTSFVGREEDLDEVARLLPRARLLTLVGAGGCGKTRLGLQVAAEALGRFRDGVWLVELAPLSDPDLLSRAVASALSVKPEPGRPLLETLRERVRERQLLVLLDNCEHVIAAAARLVHDLLTRCPELRVLATSREPLRITGETVWQVAPLATPAARVSALRELGGFDACRLFLDRARAAAPRREISDDGAALVGRICRRLDGIPLAIELAAARTRQLDLRELHRGLDDRFRLLSQGDRTALPRHQTLRAAIDWSYELLTAEERALLARLSVFAGGWTETDARGVCGEEVDAALAHLLDQSLVVVSDRRYSMLETLRVYASEKLEESAEAAACRGRHAALFAEMVRLASAKAGGHEAAEWYGRVEAELDNVRAAFEWMLQCDELKETGLRAAAQFWNFCWVRGYMPEGRRWLARFLEGAEEYASAKAQASAHYAAGILAKELGDYAQAREHYQRNLALSGEAEPGTLRASTLYALGHVVRIEGDYAEALRLYGESLAISEAQGELRGMGGTLEGLSSVCALEGDFEGARAHATRAFELFQQAGDRIGELIALISVGGAQHALGQLREARRTLRRSLRIARELKDRQGGADALRRLGRIETGEGRHRRARVLLAAALRQNHEVGSRPGVVHALEALAELAEAEGKRERGARLRGAVQALSKEMGIPAPDVPAPAQPMTLDQAIAYALG